MLDVSEMRLSRNAVLPKSGDQAINETHDGGIVAAPTFRGIFVA